LVKRDGDVIVDQGLTQARHLGRGLAPGPHFLSLGIRLGHGGIQNGALFEQALQHIGQRMLLRAARHKSHWTPGEGGLATTKQ
jgi:hypothetical protein